MQLNKVLLFGNLTRDPECRYTPKGMAVADVGLAVNNTYTTDGGERKEDPCFVDVVVWGKQAEAVNKYLKKGSSCLVEGRLKYETWEKNGEKRSKLKVVAERVQFGPAPKGEGRAGDGVGRAETDASLEDDSIPF